MNNSSAPMNNKRWYESSFAGVSRIRCGMCRWQMSASIPRNALGRWSHLRSQVWKHICAVHPESVPERFRPKEEKKS